MTMAPGYASRSMARPRAALTARHACHREASSRSRHRVYDTDAELFTGRGDRLQMRYGIPARRRHATLTLSREIAMMMA